MKASFAKKQIHSGWRTTTSINYIQYNLTAQLSPEWCNTYRTLCPLNLTEDSSSLAKLLIIFRYIIYLSEFHHFCLLPLNVNEGKSRELAGDKAIHHEENNQAIGGYGTNHPIEWSPHNSPYWWISTLWDMVQVNMLPCYRLGNLTPLSLTVMNDSLPVVGHHSKAFSLKGIFWREHMDNIKRAQRIYLLILFLLIL